MHDVVVVGAGNAALCAAMSAQEAGASVLVLEKASKDERGGNTFFTGGGFRFPYDGLDDIRALIPDLSEQEAARIEVGSYTEADMRADLMRVSEGLAQEALVDQLVRNAAGTMRWMRDRLDVRWVLMYGRQAYEVEGKLRFWGGLIVEAVGAGTGLSDSLFEAADHYGVEVRYGTKVTELLMDDPGAVCGVVARGPNGRETFEGRSVVMAAGGFEANQEMRSRYLGPGWELAKVRGTRHNTGEGIRMSLDAGAQSFGHWSSGHAVAWDLNAPPTGNRIVGDLYQKHSYPLGIIVNIDGERFVDEGADMRNYTYAKYGREILRQPFGVAFQLFDQRTVPLLRDEYRIREITKAEGDTIAEIADRLGIDAEGLERTVAEFNAACQPGEFNPAVLDGVHTEGIDLPKSNWALPLVEPPFFGVAVTCGITFTFGGLRIDAKTAAVLDTEDVPIPGLYAAGELVGGLFYHNYAGGTGLMSGSVFGRTAGRDAAEAALRR